MTPEILKAKEECEAAFAEHPEATWAWCIHHEILLEPLTENFQNRIKFIVDSKLEEEQEKRFLNFRPFIGELPDFCKTYDEARKTYDEAYKTYDEVRKTFNEACKTYYEALTFDEVRKTFNEAYKTFNEARETFNEARETFNEARETFNEACKTYKLQDLHIKQYPNNTWNGSSIF